MVEPIIYRVIQPKSLKLILNHVLNIVKFSDLDETTNRETLVLLNVGDHFRLARFDVFFYIKIQ